MNLWNWANVNAQSESYVGCHQLVPSLDIIVSCAAPVQIDALALRLASQ